MKYKLNKLFTLVLILIPCLAWSQFGEIVGPNTVNVGQTALYSITGVPYGSYTWSVTGGYVESEYVDGGYNAYIHWTSDGQGTIYFVDNNMGGIVTLNVTVYPACTVPDYPSLSFSIAPSSCAPRTLSYTGTPPAGVTWYWQTNTYGTDTSYPSNSFSIYSSGTYYVRAMDNSTGCWSEGSQAIAADAFFPPGTPSVPTASTNTCGAKTLTRGTPPSGITWYWQGTDPNGESLSNSATTYSVTSSGTYYIRARINSGSCWSAAAAKTVTVSETSPPSTPTVTSNGCGPQTLTRGNPSGGDLWYWQGTNSAGTSTANSNSTYSATSTGTYYLRAYNTGSGCWSSPSSVYVTVVTAPSEPSASLEVSINLCGDKTITASGTPPSGVTWNWEGTNANGTMTSGSSYPYNASSSGTYYLRSYSYSTNCWSTLSQSVNVTVNSYPPTPNTPTTTTNACGDQTLSVSGTPPGGVTWYWQGPSSSGMDPSNSNATYTASLPNTYYLRAKNSNCWSPNSSSVYAPVNVIPSTPTASISNSGNTCGQKTLTATGTPPTNTTWNWQGTNMYGELINAHTNSYTAASSGMYYLRAKSNAGCWSVNSQLYSVTINDPPAPNSPTTTTNSCGDQALTKSGTPPANTTWYWQGTNASGTDYTSGNAMNATYYAPSTGTYYLRSRNNLGCWSTSSSVAVTVNQNPAAPATPTVSSNTCGEKTLSSSAAPGGFTWYWQGNNPDDESTASATPATYATSGTNWYYVRTRNNTTGCWSVPTGLYIPIDVPADPLNNTFAFCEFETMAMETTGQPQGGTLKWYTDQLVYEHTGSSYTVVKNPGTYVYKVQALSFQNCPSANYATVTLSVPFNCDDKINWTENTGYTIDVNGNPVAIAASKAYADGFGKPVQSQSKSFVANQVLASQPVYDKLGNATLNTLPAPILSNSFAYKPNFVTNASGQKYSANDFDLETGSGSVFNPNPVGNSAPGTLGWYYSTNNNLEPNTPTTSYPYSRSWAPAGPDPTTGESAGPGDQHRMGSNHETASERQTFTVEELGHYYKLKHHFVSNESSGSSISPGPGYWSVQGNVTVVPGGTYTYRVKGYRTTDQASLYVGSNSLRKNLVWMGPTLPTTEGYVETTFTVPMECSDVVLGVMWNTGVQGSPFYVTESTFFQTGAAINTNLHETSVAGYKYITTDPNGKQAVSFIDQEGRELASATKNGSVYDNWSYSYYNQTGQVVASVAPNGVNTGSTAYPSFVTLYKYDHLGKMIETAATDEGTTQYVFSLDGKIRFSQNQEQRNATPKRFSYTNYDNLDRLIESGEYIQSGTNPFVFEPHTTITPTTYSVLNFSVLEAFGNTGVSRKLDTVRCKDYTFIEYDKQATDFIVDGNHPAQTFTYGQVTKTENQNATTWYCYDEFGQLVWTKQKINGFKIKAIDYTYDFLGNVTQIIYQKDSADAFYHHYVYNVDQQLSEVWTSLNGTSKTLRAKYYYYLHGPLKRVELASNVQGMDFVYTINGALKTINNADPARDPNHDGANGFAPDVFGQSMYYYDNDYTGAGYNAGTQTFSGYTNQYGGALKGVSWHTPVDNNMKINSYAFTYDNIYQLNEAKFGSSVTGAFAGVSAYKESVPSYDKNGNIQSLVRDGLNGANLGNYGYVYEANTNKLDKVNHNSAQLVDYSYNAIGQMTQQVEGTETMKVAYNAYGITKEVKNASNQLVVSYAYDDRGDLVKRVDYINGVAAKNTFYVRDASGNELSIYQQVLPVGTLQRIEVPIYGAGRVATFKPLVNTFFYEIGDHLGNVRAVIGTTDTDVYTATMESENAGSEIPPFKNVNETRVVSVAANHTTGGNETVRLNNTKPAGPAISLAVSPGDLIDLQTWAYYEAGSNYQNSISSSTMIGAIAAAFGGISGAPGEAGQIFNSINNAFGAGGVAMGGTGDPALPGAYLCYIVFDVNKNLTVPLQAGYTRVTSAGNMAKEMLTIPQITIEHPGYIYVCMYNRSDSPNWVYFDDMKVTHAHSPIVAGADYFPFGLPMEGREITQEDYRWGYQGQYAEADSVTGWNQFQLRMYDARFGRWLSVDPNGQYASPYLAMGNTPNTNIDPDGGIDLPAAVIHSFSTSAVYAAVSTITSTMAAFACCPQDRRLPNGNYEIPINPSDEQLKRWNSPIRETIFDKPTGLVEPPKYYITANDSWLDNWAASTSIAGSVSYDVANSIYYFAGSFFARPFIGEPRNLDGTFPTQREKEVTALSGMMSMMPMSASGNFTRWLNKGNWWRFGPGWNPNLGLKGGKNIRLAWGAAPKYLKEVPKSLHGLNKWLRKIGGGHKHFPKWKKVWNGKEYPILKE